MAKKNNYWRDRELKHIKANKKSDAQLSTQIAKSHKRAMTEIEKEIESFYGRYAKAEGITMPEARKRVAALDIDRYAEKAKRYVKGAHSVNEDIRMQSFTARANEEMRIYNATMRINRLELLKSNIALELAAMTSDAEHLLLKAFTEGAMQEFERQAGILGMTVHYDGKTISNIVNASFHGAHWSDRLWTNQRALQKELDVLLSRGIIQGKNPRALIKDLRGKFDVSYSDAERLLITEMARVQTDAFTETLEAGESYEYIAEPDACPICAELDGQIFKKEDAEVGINMNPMHPRCRCASGRASDRVEWEKEMQRRGL